MLWRIVKLDNIRRTTLITIGMVLFIAGLGLARLKLPTTELYLGLGCVFMALMIILRQRSNRLIICAALVLSLGVGLWRGTVYMHKIEAYQDLFGESLRFEAVVRDDAVYSKRGQLTFPVSGVELLEPQSANIVGNILIEGYGEPMVYRGDRVEIVGKLYPKRGDNQAGVSFANIRLIASNQSLVDKLRRNFAAGIQNALPEPLASFGMGLLIGQRNTLPDDINQQLIDTGLVHIVAVSGYNVTVLINLSQRLLQRRSRFQSLALSSALIGIFLLFTGSSPSIVRASVVSLTGLIMWYWGRDMKPMMILMLSAVLTAGFYPLYLWSSIGWYLSFTAFFGVLVMAPLLKERFVKKRWRDKLIPQVLSETFAAQICTLPIILWIFGRLAVVSIVANLMVVPFVPFAMLASLVAGIYGMVGPIALGGLLVLPAQVLLEYILLVGALFSRLPNINMELSVTALQMIGLYILIVAWTVLLWKKQLKSAIIKAEE